MEDIKIKLLALWVTLMLTYLLGDMLQIFASEFELEKIACMQPTQVMLLRIAVLMLIPVVMIVLDPNVEVSRDSLGKYLRSHNPFWLYFLYKTLRFDI